MPLETQETQNPHFAKKKLFFYTILLNHYGVSCFFIYFLIFFSFTIWGNCNLVYFSLIMMQYGAKQLVGCAVWGNFPFFWWSRSTGWGLFYLLHFSITNMGYFFNTNAVWGETLCGLCSMGEFSFFLLKLLHRMGSFLFVAFFNHKYGVFF